MVTFEALLIAFLVFNVLETRRRYKLTTNLAIVKFFKQIIHRFVNYREICRRGPNYIKKMVKKAAAERMLIKFSFLAIGRSNPRLFS